MPDSKTLDNEWWQYAADIPTDATARQRVLMRRAFYFGARQTLLLLNAGAQRGNLMDECVQFGRVVGTPAE